MQIGNPRNDDFIDFETRILIPLQRLQEERWFEPEELKRLAVAKLAEVDRQAAPLKATAAAAEMERARTSADYARANKEMEAAKAEAAAAFSLLDQTVNTQSYLSETALYLAASHGRWALVRMLLEARADVSLPSPLHRGRRPLHAAAMNGHVAVAEALICVGAGVDETDYDGHTAASLAEANQHWRLLRILRR